MPSQPDALTELLSRLVGAPVTLGFGLVLLVHIPAGLTCVVTGAVALLSRACTTSTRRRAKQRAWLWRLPELSQLHQLAGVRRQHERIHRRVQRFGRLHGVAGRGCRRCEPDAHISN
jgi:hypothetical protein